VVGVFCLHAAPNCALWGSMTANMPREILKASRDKENLGLQFLAMVCFVQFLMGRHFLIENSGTSRIFAQSPIRCLDQIGLHVSKLDECMHGAKQESTHIKKSSTFVSDCLLTGFDTCCDHSHEHLQLRGHRPRGSRTAAAPMRPKALCDRILANIAAMRITPQDGGRDKPSHTFVVPADFGGKSKRDQVVDRLQEL